MKAAIICFTIQGQKTAVRIRQQLWDWKVEATVWCKMKTPAGKTGLEERLQASKSATGQASKPVTGQETVQASESIPEQTEIMLVSDSLAQWTSSMFESCDALIFVGATGIAVRSIAPCIRSKAEDPAVLVVDELGKFVISLLSGHIGGANALCRNLAEQLGAIPVITTATDLNKKFAVDLFAVQNRLWITDLSLAKEVSAAVLVGRQVSFYSEFPLEGNLPEELTLTKPEDMKAVGAADNASDNAKALVAEDNASDNAKAVGTGDNALDIASDNRQLGICVSTDQSKHPFEKTLYLIPKAVSLGIGCKKGKSAQEIETAVKAALEEWKIPIQALEQVCSIDVKAQEQGILQFCEVYQLPFLTYTAEELEKAEGVFSASDFVKSQVGIDNVCERSAVLGSQGRLLQKKSACDGITVAAAVKNRRIYFE